jgi:hypothetical protein
MSAAMRQTVMDAVFAVSLSNPLTSLVKQNM